MRDEMTTPVADFIRAYLDSGTERLHMPGHKGAPVLGCEAWDITEIQGADSLYEASGILAESQRNAARLFGARRTLYATEGSSQCIRAMVHMACLWDRCKAGARGGRPRILAARNAHKAFLYATASEDADITWLWPDGDADSLCACPVASERLEALLQENAACAALPTAVYVTAPDYLGGMQDIAALAAVCRRYGTLLLVDNAHGAYLHFLPSPVHPMDLGADLCCDSAHKTLPVLTGGAYLHIGAGAPAELDATAQPAMALYGSTSPSYLTLASLDLCNRYLAEAGRERIAAACAEAEALRGALRARGWQIVPSDPLRVTVRAAGCGMTGRELADRLRGGRMECEYADRDYTVLMLTPDNRPGAIARIVEVLGDAPRQAAAQPAGRTAEPTAGPTAAQPAGPTAGSTAGPAALILQAPPQRVLSVREALFAPQEIVPVRDAVGRICGAPTVSCPPAIPVVVSGERIPAEAVPVLLHYGIGEVAVVQP